MKNSNFNVRTFSWLSSASLKRAWCSIWMCSTDFILCFKDLWYLSWDRRIWKISEICYHASAYSCAKLQIYRVFVLKLILYLLTRKYLAVIFIDIPTVESISKLAIVYLWYMSLCHYIRHGVTTNVVILDPFGLIGGNIIEAHKQLQCLLFGGIFKLLLSSRGASNFSSRSTTWNWFLTMVIVILEMTTI